jgi:hypothetical protein
VGLPDYLIFSSEVKEKGLGGVWEMGFYHN